VSAARARARDLLPRTEADRKQRRLAYEKDRLERYDRDGVWRSDFNGTEYTQAYMDTSPDRELVDALRKQIREARDRAAGRLPL
jgi:hypothetical protein